MSVQNAGLIIKEARRKAGLSQEQLSEGVCTPLSLSRIENGSAGVSPATFQALMAHAGASCQAFPAFASRTDFDCFYTLKRVRFFLDSWQLAEAFAELEKIEHWNWADNKFYYQEWLLLHSRLQFRSGCGDHKEIYDMLLDALHISKPDMIITAFRHLLLSVNEIEILTQLAQEALCLGQTSDCMQVCLHICTQISSYLTDSPLSFVEKDRLLAENGIVHAEYLLAVCDYEKALETADHFRHQMAANMDDAPLHELTFLTALGYYYTKDTTQAYTYFKTAFFSAHSIGSCYATICKNYVLTHTDLVLPEGFSDFADIPLVSFPVKKITAPTLSDGTYDLSSPEALSIGGLIRSLRLEQKLSQATLCQGLCSKSKLSKIENGTLQPDVILAQTLLQRLGISDRVFTFYGSAREARLQELHNHMVMIRQTQTDLLMQCAEKMETFCTSKDHLYQQYLLYEKASFETDPSAKLLMLQKALSVTLPDFNSDHIADYRLSWKELTILNNLCATYVQLSPAKGILELYKLLSYYSCAALDILEEKRVFPVTVGKLILRLYKYRRFSEILEAADLFSLPVIKSSLYFTGHIYGHYCQALGQCENLQLADRYANYSYYDLLITECFELAFTLKGYMEEDFNITPL